MARPGQHYLLSDYKCAILPVLAIAGYITYILSSVSRSGLLPVSGLILFSDDRPNGLPPVSAIVGGYITARLGFADLGFPVVRLLGTYSHSSQRPFGHTTQSTSRQINTTR